MYEAAGPNTAGVHPIVEKEVPYSCSSMGWSLRFRGPRRRRIRCARAARAREPSPSGPEGRHMHIPTPSTRIIHLEAPSSRGETPPIQPLPTGPPRFQDPRRRRIRCARSARAREPGPSGPEGGHMYIPTPPARNTHPEAPSSGGETAASPAEAIGLTPRQGSGRRLRGRVRSARASEPAPSGPEGGGTHIPTPSNRDIHLEVRSCGCRAVGAGA